MVARLIKSCALPSERPTKIREATFGKFDDLMAAKCKLLLNFSICIFMQSRVRPFGVWLLQVEYKGK